MKCETSKSEWISYFPPPGIGAEFHRQGSFNGKCEAERAMDAKRWKQIEDVLQSVLDCSSDQRDAFLREACAGDEILEREVRSFLVVDEESRSFLQAPAMDVAARALARQRNSELPEDSASLIG